jgi:NAD(P)-dependent dehydrogenase (short-subunit alcohol dehydrogenase family)
MAIDLSGRVAIVTGAGAGLGREHALALAGHGAKVVVNDLPEPGGASPAQSSLAVVEDIQRAGGQAIALAASVTDPQAVQDVVNRTLEVWGRVDILVNNAGVLRDKSFAKMTLEDFRFVIDVHLMGSVHFTKAVWEPMRAQGHGRIIMTTSSSGLFGNFGQSNYGAAKMALVGLMQTLALEGAKHNIRVNALAPTAATRMTEGILPAVMLEKLQPSRVAPAVVFLASDEAPNKTILCAGGGSFECSYITLTQGIHVPDHVVDVSGELAARFAQVADRSDDAVPASGMDQGRLELSKAFGSS